MRRAERQEGALAAARAGPRRGAAARRGGRGGDAARPRALPAAGRRPIASSCAGAPTSPRTGSSASGRAGSARRASGRARDRHRARGRARRAGRRHRSTSTRSARRARPWRVATPRTASAPRRPPGRRTPTRIWVLGDSGTGGRRRAGGARRPTTAFNGGRSARPVADARRQRLRRRHGRRVPAGGLRHLPRLAGERSSCGRPSATTTPAAPTRPPRADRTSTSSPCRRGRGRRRALRHRGLLLVRLAPTSTSSASTRRSSISPPDGPMLTWLADDLRHRAGDWIDRLLAPPALQQGVARLRRRGRSTAMRENAAAGARGLRRRPGADRPQPLLRALRTSSTATTGPRTPTIPSSMRSTPATGAASPAARTASPRGRRATRGRSTRWRAAPRASVAAASITR